MVRESECERWAVQHGAYCLAIRCVRSSPPLAVGPGIVRMYRYAVDAQRDNRREVWQDFRCRLTAAGLGL